MEAVPQPNFCPVEPEDNQSQAKKPVKNTNNNTNNQPMGVVPPDLPGQAQAPKAEKSSKTSPWLFILVMILLAVSSGLGYLLVSGQTNALLQLLPIN